MLTEVGHPARKEKRRVARKHGEVLMHLPDVVSDAEECEQEQESLQRRRREGEGRPLPRRREQRHADFFISLHSSFFH